MDSQNLKISRRTDEKHGFLEKHGRGILALVVVVLLVHDIFGTHGFMSMRRTQSEIERVKKDLDRLNSENSRLSDEVKALRSDPKLIEKIAREDLKRARPGEIIIRIPPPPPPAPMEQRSSPAKP